MNVGDYVQSNDATNPAKHLNLSGKVRSRLFRYVRTKDEICCHVNIVVEKEDDDWGKLIKE